MDIFKRIINNVSSIFNDDQPQNSAGNKSSEKLPYELPDYSAYVDIKPGDDIYIVSFSDNIYFKFPEITSEYEKACNTYNSVKHMNTKEHNYRGVFERLNVIFEMVVKWFCTNASIPCEEKSIVESAKSLKKVGFNSEQMNVVYGVLYAMDLYKDSSLTVPDIDIKKHFISVGYILKIFNEAARGKKIETVSCSIKAEKKEKKGIIPQSTPDKNQGKQKSDSLMEEFKRAKQLNKQNMPREAVKALSEVLTIAADRVYEEKNILQKPEKISDRVADLKKRGIVSKLFIKSADGILSKMEECEKGTLVKRKQVQKLIQCVGSCLLHVKTCLAPKKKKNKNQQTKQNETGQVKPKASINRPSFKQIEKRTENNNTFDLKTEYPDLVVFIETANKRIANGEYKEALSQYRNALEFMVNTLCNKYGVLFDSKTILFDKIEKLHEADVLSQTQLGLMHSARQHGNNGAHYNAGTATENEAKQEADLIEKVKDMFINLMLTDNMNKNTPMIDPDFYSISRKYYGLWTYVTRKEQLLLDMNYIKLKRKADAGDIEAMLDLSIGFLPKPEKMQWDFDHLIVSPDFEKSGFGLRPAPFDMRYYFWLIKAGKKAYNNWMTGKDVPLKYIATALAECIKLMPAYIIYDRYAKYSAQYTALYEPQRNLAEYLFEEKISFDSNTISQFAVMLICMLEEYKDDMNGKGSIIAPIHNMSILDIKHYVYLYNFYANPHQKVTLDPKLLISAKHRNMTYKEVVTAKDSSLGGWRKLEYHLSSKKIIK